MSRQAWRLLLDGFALAVALAAFFCAVRLGLARDTIESLRAAKPPVDVEPRGLVAAWTAVTVLGGAAAWYVAHRLLALAFARADPDSQNRLRNRFLLTVPFLAVGAWAGLQVIGVLEVVGTVDAHDCVSQAGFYVVVTAGLLTAGYTAGSVVGNAMVAGKRVAAVRIQLLLLATLFVLVFSFPFTSDQLSDVLRAWGDAGDDSWSRPLTGIAAALLLGATCRASAARLLIPPDAGIRPPAKPRGRLVASAILLAAGALLAVLGLAAAAFLIAALALVLVLSTPAPPLAPIKESPEVRDSLRRLAGTLGTIPMAVLLAGIVGALTDSLLLPGETPSRLILWTTIVFVVFALLAAGAHVPGIERRSRFGAGLAGAAGLLAALCFFVDATIAAGLLVFLVLGLLFPPSVRAAAELSTRELGAASGVALGLGLTVYVEPLEVSRGAGAFGLALIGLAGILVLLHAAASVGMRRAPVVGVCGWPARVPVVLLLAAWFAVALWTAPDTAHQARTMPTDNAPASLGKAVDEWLQREAEPAAKRGSRRPVPMLLVAASGGGAKAAYWTDLVLDCILGEGVPQKATDECRRGKRAAARRGRLFLTSSVSGGSVGIYHYVTQRRAGTAKPWVNATAGKEILSPVVAWGLFHDLPALLIGADTNPQRCDKPLECSANADRALIQEAALEQVTADTGPAGEPPALRLLDRTSPLMIFNGSYAFAKRLLPDRTVVLSHVQLAGSPHAAGCPRDASQPLDAETDGHDVLLAGEDVRLVTAAMLSARFPLLEPPGRLGVTTNDPPAARCAPRRTLEPVVIRDGGLIENTGLRTIVRLLPAVQAAIGRWQKRRPERRRVEIRPIVVSIDDDVPRVQVETGLRRVWGKFFGAASKRTDGARDELDNRSPWNVQYERISPRPHVGAQAATGWEVSQASRRGDLGSSIREAERADESGDGDPGPAIRRVRATLDGGP